MYSSQCCQFDRHNLESPGRWASNPSLEDDLDYINWGGRNDQYGSAISYFGISLCNSESGTGTGMYSLCVFPACGYEVSSCFKYIPWRLCHDWTYNHTLDCESEWRFFTTKFSLSEYFTTATEKETKTAGTWLKSDISRKRHSQWTKAFITQSVSQNNNKIPPSSHPGIQLLLMDPQNSTLGCEQEPWTNLTQALLFSTANPLCILHLCFWISLHDFAICEFFQFFEQDTTNLETPPSSWDRLRLLLRVPPLWGLWTVHILSEKEGQEGSLDSPWSIAPLRPPILMENCPNCLYMGRIRVHRFGNSRKRRLHLCGYGKDSILAGWRLSCVATLGSPTALWTTSHTRSINIPVCFLCQLNTTMLTIKEGVLIERLSGSNLSEGGHSPV